ncbi:hypothetical protein SORBI_3001G059150, partial [Sorghum bicolor]
GSVPAVTLRRFELTDVDAMMEWASDPEAEAVLAFLRDAVLRHQWFRAVCLGVELEPRPVGAVSVTPTDDACRAELCGVATAAVKRAVAAVFGEFPGVVRVEALVDVDNPAARRVLENAGFQREAVLRSYCVRRLMLS